MELSWDEIYAGAVAFSKRWEHGRSEKSEAQSFVRDFLAVFGVEDPAAVGMFENPALRESGDGYMDYFWPGKIAIEMKSKGKDLKGAYEQLKDYVLHREAEEMPDLLMVSDFETIILYHRTTNKRKQFKTKDLRKNTRHFSILAGYETKRDFEEQYEIDVRAAEKMAKLHDALKDSGYEGHELEIYLVRLLFCLFAEDTGIFPQDCFLDYVRNSKDDGSNLSDRIVRLFEVLNMPDSARAKRTLLSVDLKEFQYVNGGLFEDRLSPADFDAKMRQTLIDCCKFDWSKISPAIFGAMFQGVLNKKLRRELGAHYTSEENILKLLKPLFLDELWEEFERKKINAKSLDEFHNKIAGLKFLDPACGCGNFLIITYRELRKLEIEILKMKLGRTRQKRLDISSLLKVSIEQFYGIEIEDFPCEVARVGMWLADHQMNLLVAEEFGQYFARLPLIQSATIIHKNALRSKDDNGIFQPLDWESIVPKNELSYILGNPPFVGYSNQSEEQKADILLVCRDADGKPIKGAAKIDYVSAWYYKAAKLLAGTTIRAAFVSTNSITQGEQVGAVWKPIFEMFGIHIDFAYRTFVWSNEAKGKAAVHCVIVGFSAGAGGKRTIFNGAAKIEAKNINPYLVDGETIFIESRRTPLCDVPEMIAGGKPTEGGHLILSEEERALLLKAEPNAKKYIRRYYMGDDFINDGKRYCLWLVDCPASELRHMPLVKERVERVRQMRLESKKAATRAKAATPMYFDEIRKITGDRYLAIPKVSSERRNYIPIGFLPVENIPGDKLFVVCGMGLYGFGVLTSSVHMAWMRVVAGRLKSDYSYSNTIVYNNFPWPEPTDKQKTEIELLAQAVLDARALYPNDNFADLYDPAAMKKELFKAHQRLDRAVMKLYGFKSDTDEPRIVAMLMKLYQELCAKKLS